MTSRMHHQQQHSALFRPKILRFPQNQHPQLPFTMALPSIEEMGIFCWYLHIFNTWNPFRPPRYCFPNRKALFLIPNSVSRSGKTISNWFLKKIRLFWHWHWNRAHCWRDVTQAVDCFVPKCSNDGLRFGPFDSVCERLHGWLAGWQTEAYFGTIKLWETENALAVIVTEEMETVLKASLLWNLSDVCVVM